MAEDKDHKKVVNTSDKDPGETSSLHEPPGMNTSDKDPGETSSLHEPPGMKTFGKEPGETRSLHEPPRMTDLRIVLVGKTGVGKSSTGNTILGKKAFDVSSSAQSVTKDCLRVKAEVDGREVSVVDTPGLFDTDLTESTVINRLVECITLSCPGPHVFLLVLTVGRFTEEDRQTMKRLQQIFGEEAPKYSIVLFTRGDQLTDQTIEEFLEEAGPDLKQVLKMCGGRYHVFNNENMADRSQVSKLMEKVVKMVLDNGDSCYSNEMYENVERAIQEREEELKHEMSENVEKSFEELRNEMGEVVKVKDMEISQLRSELRERLVKDVKKKKFTQIKKIREQCVQQ